MTARHLSWVALVAAVTACGEQRSPTAPHAAPATVPQAEISDGAHASGNAHFYFLPPLVPASDYRGTSDSTLSPTVMVCEWSQGACTDVVISFPRSDAAGARAIRYDPQSQAYAVNWKTDECLSGPCSLDPAKAYRLRVLIGAVELGHADLAVAATGAGLRNVDNGAYVGLVGGRTLPIKFRIEQGAVVVLASGEGTLVGSAGTSIASGDGQVALEIPPGALAAPATITVSPATDVPPGIGPWSVPVDVGPSGTTFSTPITLTLAFDPTKLPPGVLPQDVGLYSQIDGGWQEVPNGTVNLIDNTVSAPISHFSVYSISIRPNTIQGTPSLTTLAVGQTTTLAGYVTGYQTRPVTYCYWTRQWYQSWGRWRWYWVQRCVTYTQTTFYPQAYTVVAWRSINSTSPAVVFMGPYSMTDANGVTTSPPIVGANPGATNIVAIAGGVSSNPVRVTVMGRFSLSPQRADLVAGWLVNQRIARTSGLSDVLPVRITQVNNRLLRLSDPATGTTWDLAQAGVSAQVVLNPGAPSKDLVVAGLSGVGVDTLAVSAPFYFPDLLVFTFVRGKMLLGGWPSAGLQVGDSAALQLSVADQSGALGTLAVPITFALAPTSGLVFTDGHATISSIGVPQRTSATFYVKAVAPGTQSVAITHQDYDTYTNTVDVQPPPSPATGFRDLAAGWWHTCGLTGSGQAYCWGYGGWGEGGDGTQNLHSAPVEVLGGLTFTQLAVMVNHVCGLDAAGYAYCWGGQQWGELGTDAPQCIGGLSCSTSPVPVDGGHTFTQIVGGYGHTCGLDRDGRAYCWGLNSWGQLGNGLRVYTSPLAPVAGGLTFTQLAAGRNYTCGLTGNGQAYCWGYNGAGQLGFQTPPSAPYSLTPAPVVGGLAFTQLAIGTYADHTCGLTSDGRAYCWGNNSAGALGDGSTSSSSSPVPVAGGLTFTALTGGDHTCGVTGGGVAYCWGNNSSGQLGNASTTNSSIPVAVTGGLAFTQIASGESHTCGLTSGGTVYCWGANHYGQVGDGTTATRLAPVRLAGTP